MLVKSHNERISQIFFATIQARGIDERTLISLGFSPELVSGQKIGTLQLGAGEWLAFCDLAKIKPSIAADKVKTETYLKSLELEAA